MSAEPSTKGPLRVFDIRNIIGALLGIYGLLLAITGFVPSLVRQHDNAAAAGNRVELYIGTDANWWVGLVLIGVAALFIGWALLRPVSAPVADSG